MITSHLPSPDAAQSPTRDRIYGLIVERPGTSLTELCRTTGHAIGTIQYHLYVLRRFRLVHAVKVGRYVRYFAVGQTAPMEENRAAAFADARLSDVLHYVEEHPGCTIGEVSFLAGKTRQAGACHVARLVRMGLLRVEVRGRTKLVWLAGKSRTDRHVLEFCATEALKPAAVTIA